VAKILPPPKLFFSPEFFFNSTLIQPPMAGLKIEFSKKTSTGWLSYWPQKGQKAPFPVFCARTFQGLPLSDFGLLQFYYIYFKEPLKSIDFQEAFKTNDNIATVKALDDKNDEEAAKFIAKQNVPSIQDQEKATKSWFSR
jgi:hypothetical protein